MVTQHKSSKVETKAEAETLIPLFKFERILNQDQNGRRITLLGTIKDEPAVFTLERAAFPSDANIISSFLTTLANTTNLGANDVYRWYMSNHSPTPTTTTSNTPPIPDLKLNLIYPCTPTHIRKYTSQSLRYVTESPQIYNTYVRPYIDRTQRTPKRIDWIYNILDGITEQDDIVYRSPDFLPPTSTSTTVTTQPSTSPPGGFLLLPDLNWDRKTLTSLHLLALVQRRDLTSLRDLRTTDLPWLKTMLTQIRAAAARHGNALALAAAAARAQQSSTSSDDTNINTNTDTNTDTTTIDADQIKCYVHYQPTYYHFHIHVVHVLLEPEGGTQSVGKAFGLETLVAMLEALAVAEGKGNENEDKSRDAGGLDQVDLTYFIGEESEIWKKCFARLKKGERVDLLDGI